MKEDKIILIVNPGSTSLKFKLIAFPGERILASGKLERVTIAGKFCESGDILIRDIDLPKVEPGDILAVPCCGAYCLPLASNYNAALRPAVVMVRDGDARIIRRRESYDDLMRCDIL